MRTQPNRWKIAFGSLALVSFGLMGYLVLQLLDQPATLSLLRDGFQRREAALSVLRQSLPELLRGSGRLSQQEVLAILQKHNHGAPIVSGASVIEVDQMRFRFAADGSLARVEKTDDYGTRASDTPTNRPAMPER